MKPSEMPKVGDVYTSKSNGKNFAIRGIDSTKPRKPIQMGRINDGFTWNINLETLNENYTPYQPKAGEKAMRQLPKKDRRWSFQAHHQNEINFDAIASELSKANPIAVVKWNHTEYIVMRNKFHHMANEKGVDDSILIVKSNIELRKINEEIYYLIIVYEDKNLPTVKDFIEWARKVQRSPWPVKKADRTTKVIIPDLS